MTDLPKSFFLSTRSFEKVALKASFAFGASSFRWKCERKKKRHLKDDSFSHRLHGFLGRCCLCEFVLIYIRALLVNFDFLSYDSRLKKENFGMFKFY